MVIERSGTAWFLSALGAATTLAYRGADVQDRPDVVLRVFFTAFDDLPDVVQGAPELVECPCDEDEPVVLRPPACDDPVALRELPDDLPLSTSGSIRG
jgi:hypothetical protein